VGVRVIKAANGKKLYSLVFPFLCQEFEASFSHPFSFSFFDSCRVNVICRDEVPHFGPILKNPPTFESKKELRDFVLTKCLLLFFFFFLLFPSCPENICILVINGETSTYQSPAFVKKMMRTLEGSLQVINTEHGPTAKSIKKSAPISGLKPVSLSSRATISAASVSAGGTNAAVNNIVSICFDFFLHFLFVLLFLFLLVSTLFLLLWDLACVCQNCDR